MWKYIIIIEISKTGNNSSIKWGGCSSPIGNSVVVMWRGVVVMWRRGIVVITTVQRHSTKPELRLCAVSNPARDVSEIRDDGDL